MLSSKVTSLTSLGSSDLTRVVFTTVGGIQMTESSSAVSISWDWKTVNVIDWVCQYSRWRTKATYQTGRTLLQMGNQ